MFMRLLYSCRSLSVLLILSCLAATTGCGFFPPIAPPPPTCNNPNGPGGFTAHVSDINQNGVAVGDDPSGSAFGTFASALPNTKLQGCSGGASFGSSSDFVRTPVNVQFGEAPALWSGAFKAQCISPIDEPGGVTWSTTLFVGDPINPNGGGPLNMLGACSVNAATSFFELSGSLPPHLTIPGSGLSTKFGPPQLELNSVKANGLVSATQALSVASDGSSATFNFPVNSTGNTLGSGLYAYQLQQQTGPGVYTTVAADVLTIGTASTLTAPFGVEAINRFIFNESCIVEKVGPSIPHCTATNTTEIIPLVTLLNSANLNYFGTNIAVGSQPTAVAAYDTTQTTTGTPGCGPTFGNSCSSTTITQPSLALVANSGSNTVSVVSLLNRAVTATINVGTQPVAILIANPHAYVANLASNTVSQIDLSLKTVSGTVSVGSTPTSLAMDPSGSAFWVGGLNYISKVNISNLSVASTFAVSGQVTSLSISSGQNAFVYTVVNGSTFRGEHADMTSGATVADFAISTPATAASVKNDATSSNLPSWLNIGGPLVSASYGNRYIVEGTPNGFAVLDLKVGKVMMQGTTSAPIVGIAVDAQQGTAFATETSANKLLSIPLPPVQTD